MVAIRTLRWINMICFSLLPTAYIRQGHLPQHFHFSAQTWWNKYMNIILKIKSFPNVYWKNNLIVSKTECKLLCFSKSFLNSRGKKYLVQSNKNPICVFIEVTKVEDFLEVDAFWYLVCSLSFSVSVWCEQEVAQGNSPPPLVEEVKD